MGVLRVLRVLCEGAGGGTRLASARSGRILVTQFTTQKQKKKKKKKKKKKQRGWRG